ncbi:recombinase family protein, partial [Intestinibacter sp.]|uniref:recombinase family protein n=1 Tax=Intestinibacter sp. TaxID=1965304 RepID=UPI002A756359
EYIKKNYNKIKKSDILIYQDEGFSGGNTNRPMFKQLIKDAQNKKFDCIICYRLDRISRNVSDFSALIERLNKLNISFVSIKEQFDTSTPMGRAMMYISSVFAQLERETIAERVKDNMYELAKQGHWLGGHPPYGFNFEKVTYFDEQMVQRKMCKLYINDEEMKISKLVYEKYLEFNSVTRVTNYLIENGVKGSRGGKMCTKNVNAILRSPAYVRTTNKVFIYLKDKGCFVAGSPDGIHGSLIYAKKSQSPIVALAKHEGVIDAEVWLKVQEMLDKNAEKAPRAGTGKVALLSNMLICGKCGSKMTLNYKSNSDITYYVCGNKKRNGNKSCNCKNLRTDKTDKLIIEHIKTVNIEKIIKEYNKMKDCNINDKKEIDIEIKKKQKKIKDIEKQVDNLVTQLSNFSESASEFLIKKIEQLNNEIEKLKEEIYSLDNSKDTLSQANLNLDILVNNINRFNKIIDEQDITQKRLLLSTIIDSLIWNDESGTITINYLGLEDINDFIEQSDFYGYK